MLKLLEKLEDPKATSKQFPQKNVQVITKLSSKRVQVISFDFSIGRIYVQNVMMKMTSKAIKERNL